MNTILKKLIPGLLFLALPGFVSAQIDETELKVLQDIRDRTSSSGAKDITRIDQAQALINFHAQELLKAYELDEQRYFMMAPGSNESIEAARNLGADVTASTQSAALQMVESLLAQGGGGSLAERIMSQAPGSTAGEGQFDSINAALLLQDSVDQNNAADIIKILTNPDSNTAPSDIKQAQMSTVISTLSKLAAKRDSEGGSKSLAQVLREESQRRFLDEEWRARLGVASQEALLRELVDLEATRAMLQYQELDLQQDLVLMIGALTAQQARLSEVFAQLTQAMQNATRAAQAAQAEAKAAAAEAEEREEERREENGDEPDSGDEEDAEAAQEEMLNRLRR